MGDFNAIRRPGNKEGGSIPNGLSMKDFDDCILDSGLLEITDPLDKFTWEREYVKEKLDWVFGNLAWETSFPNTKVFHDLKYKSDHKVVVLSFESRLRSRPRMNRFQFQSAWLLEEDFPNLVEEAWKDKDWNQGLLNFQNMMELIRETMFAEASLRQMELIRETIRRFCIVSGLKINLIKSKAFFSRNVHFNREIDLSNKLGIGVTTNLGKYLGVPLIHSRVTNETFGHIIQKVKSRLSSWKGKYLTMAGRAVLIKAVISALPSYQMQSSLLPKGVIREIEKISRNFLWCQENENVKKMSRKCT
ncbi:hypothetical protein K1719_016428 [Acacia pycnantha]|nr:hypothetical protein K1719_016428 [Acacia pycnantha]